MALWNGVGQVANIAQLTGIDAYGLISLIVEAAWMVKRNRETCQLLARRARMIGALLEQLQSTRLMQHPETRIPVEELEDTLRHAYLLIASCQEGSYLHSCFVGGKQAEKLQEVQSEITFYLQLFPLVSFVDTTRTWERLVNRDHPSCSEGTIDELHTVHHSEQDDRLRTEALKATELEDPGSVAPSRSGLEEITSQIQIHLIAGKVCKFPHFSFSQISAATNNFSRENLVGQGGFCSIYKVISRMLAYAYNAIDLGHLLFKKELKFPDSTSKVIKSPATKETSQHFSSGQLSNGLEVAVKRQTISGLQSQREFVAEIDAISNLQHKNVIALLGICVQGEEQMPIYEYMPKKCLESNIADKGEMNLLTWPKRLRIIQGIADGLAYLHGHSQYIVHRDIKASNILLDHEMNAKISDFGLAVRLDPSMPMEVDLPICGTIGYVAPEYIATGKISRKQDVYAFGIVLLEIIGGKLSYSYRRRGEVTSPGLELPEYARKYQKKPRNLIDPFLRFEEHEIAQITECVKVALLCVHHLAKHRPTMSEVVAMLARIKAGKSVRTKCMQ